MNALDPLGKRALLAQLLRRKAQRAQPIALSAAQHRLWLLDRLEPGAATYNVPYAFRIRGPLDRAALARALDTIVQRHDVLRATIRDTSGEPVYVVNDGFVLELPTIDVASATALDELLMRESTRAFDLRADAPIRVLLARVTSADHVLLVTQHHIATDGWSMGIFKRELSTLYAAYRADSGARLDEPACTYADYVEWQHERLAGTAGARQRRYWQAQLTNAPAPLQLAPARPVQPGAPGAVRARLLDCVTPSAFERFCHDRATTPFSALLAVFAVFLHRYTERRDFIIGTAIANRMRAAFEESIGFFVNTLPLRIHLDGDPSFRDWLTGIHDLSLDALDNGEVPFQTLVELAHPQRESTRPPLVNVMFVLQNAPDEPLTLAGLETARVDLPRTTAKFDLTLEVVITAAGLQLEMEYRSDLFAIATIDAMLDSIATLLAAVVAQPHSPLSHLPLLSPAARQQQLYTWNDNQRALSGKRIERLFERQAALRPNAIAIADGRSNRSYAWLNARANRLAHYLRSIRPGNGVRIGICCEPGEAGVVAMLAVLKAGAIYVPLDPQYPPERLAQMLADAAVSLVLSDHHASAALAPLAIEVLRVDRDATRFARHSCDNRTVSSDEHTTDPAYIMYTSGSTGTPKGVLVAHAGIERLVTNTDYVAISTADAVAHASTLAFDASTFEIWGPLLNGARLVVIRKAVLLAPHDLRAAIERCGITIMFVTTALLRELVRSAPSTFAGLRTLIVGGDTFDCATATRLLAAAPPAHIINGYGPTEATTFATSYHITTRPAAATIPIGRPIANTTVYVLDTERRPLPIGAVGELYIGGPGVALGYLNDPELTARKFVPDPFAATPGARLYATGDRARYGPDGQLEFLGRADGQLKLRGFRIEMGEIEAALRAYAEVSDAAVVAPDDGDGRRRLVAYVAGPAATGLECAAILDRLRGQLPGFMVPDSVVALAHLPLQANGKVDRQALLARTPSGRTKPARSARTDVQATLIALWERLLAMEPIGIDDDFFAVGGHSLLAVRMMAEVEQIFGVRLAPAVLFAGPTIQDLARALRAEPVEREYQPVIAFHDAGTAQPFFFLHGSVDGDGFYCRTLADHLGADRPLYAFRPHGQDGRPLPATIEIMATEYVALVRQIQPRGPYLVGGFCAGGLVAFEMACQLHAAGESISHVILLDVPDASLVTRRLTAGIDRAATLLGIRPPHRRRLRGSIARLPHHRRRFAACPAKGAFIAAWLTERLGRFRTGGAIRASDDLSVGLLPVWTRRAEQYVPQGYDGPLTLVLTQAENETDQAQRAGWSSLAPRLERRLVPGTHLSCIGEFIDDTARVVAQAVAETPPA